jgi:hypothetical protein
MDIENDNVDALVMEFNETQSIQSIDNTGFEVDHLFVNNSVMNNQYVS